MDIATLFGFLAGTFFIILSMLIGTNFNVAKMFAAFIDPASVMITLGGTVASALIANPLQRILKSIKAMRKTFVPPSADPAAGIDEIISLANIARKESLLALEEVSDNINDAFLEKGIRLIVDGSDPELVRNILETEKAYIESRHNEVRGVWDFIASSAPAWGMIGTLIGLILMLQDLSDPSLLGPKMAIALVTTFYGTIIANFVATPVSKKLKMYDNDEMLLKEVMIEGILSIQAGENPRIIEEKLKSFISPHLRRSENNKQARAGE